MDDIDGERHRVERRTYERREKRRAALQRLLAKTPLSAFTADYTLDICIITNPIVLGLETYRTYIRSCQIDESLDRLEAFYKKRRKH